MAATIEPQVVQIKLLPAQSPDDRKRHIVANVVVEGNTSLPYIDDAPMRPSIISQTYANTVTIGNLENDGKPRLRYYSVGPSTKNIVCPLCRQNATGGIINSGAIQNITCCLSLLSCCFPIFWLCCLCNLCFSDVKCNLSRKYLFCNKCGGNLGNHKAN